MGGALFRFEALETDVAVNTVPFTDDDPHLARFRYQHAAVGTVFDAFPSQFRPYSRYTFLRIFTALQVIFGLFTVFLFNYLSTIRYHYAPRMDNVTGTMIEHSNWAIGPLYLCGCVIGLVFVPFAAVYILYVNSEFCLDLEYHRWVDDKRARMRRAVARAPSTFNARNSSSPESHRGETIGCRLRRIGVRWISFTRPYYVFPTRYLPDFDYRHDLQVKYGERAARRNPQTVLFFCTWPIVLILIILDFITIDELRYARWSVSLLEGVTAFLGLVYVLYVSRYIMTKGMMCGRTCFREIQNTVTH